MINKQGATRLSVREVTMVATMIAIIIVLGMFPGIPLGFILYQSFYRTWGS